MASSKRYAEIVISGDASKAEQALGKVSQMGGKMGKAVAAGAAVAAAGVALAGAAVLKFGGDFQQARANIAIATGAVGDDLDALYGDFKTTLGQVPDDMETVSGAIGVANTLFGATGEALSDLTTRVLDFSRMAGGDASANMEAIGQAAKVFGLDAQQTTAAMDDLFKVTQNYNIGGDQLLDAVTKLAPAFSAMGFSIEDTAALIGQLHARGADVGRLTTDFARFSNEVTEAGGDPLEALKDLEAQMLATGDQAAASALAGERFGDKNAAAIAALVFSGGSLTNLNGVLGDNAGLIDETAAATASMGEKWNEFKNKVLVKLEPVITKMFDALMSGMDWVSANAIPVVERLVAVFNEGGLAGVIGYLGDKFREAWPSIRAALVGIGEGILAWIGEMVPVLLEQLGEWGQAFVDWIGPRIVPALQELGRMIGALLDWLLNEGLPLAVEKLLEFGQAFVEWVAPLIPPLLAELGKLLVQIGDWIVTDAAPTLLAKLAEWTVQFLAWVTTDLIPDLLGKLPGVVTAIGTWVTNEGATMVKDALAGVFDAFLDWIRDDLPGLVGSAVAGAFDGIASAFDGIIAGIKQAWNSLDPSISVSVPGWVPIFGGRSWSSPDLIPDFHSGGTFVPPRGAREGIAMLRAGEFVSSPGNATNPGASTFGGDVVFEMDGTEWGRIQRATLEAEGRRGGPYRIRVEQV